MLGVYRASRLSTLTGPYGRGLAVGPVSAARNPPLHQYIAILIGKSLVPVHSRLTTRGSVITIQPGTRKLLLLH